MNQDTCLFTHRPTVSVSVRMSYWTKRLLTYLLTGDARFPSRHSLCDRCHAPMTCHNPMDITRHMFTTSSAAKDDADDEAISTHSTNYVIPTGLRPEFIRNPVRRKTSARPGRAEPGVTWPFSPPRSLITVVRYPTDGRRGLPGY